MMLIDTDNNNHDLKEEIKKFLDDKVPPLIEQYKQWAHDYKVSFLYIQTHRKDAIHLYIDFALLHPEIFGKESFDYWYDIFLNYFNSFFRRNDKNESKS